MNYKETTALNRRLLDVTPAEMEELISAMAAERGDKNPGGPQHPSPALIIRASYGLLDETTRKNVSRHAFACGGCLHFAASISLELAAIALRRRELAASGLRLSMAGLWRESAAEPSLN